MNALEQRLKKVIKLIDENIDDHLTLEKLSDAACVSKFHFHRLFTAYTGVSVQQYIRWLRLKRAAHELAVEQDKPIITIAMSAGFESHEAFTRAFKQQCGQSPSMFRQRHDWSAWKAPYTLPQPKGENMINVTIKTMKARRLAAVEHRASPDTVSQSVQKLVDWAKAQNANLKPKAGEAFGFGYDDPKTTKPEDFRFDLAITIPANLKLDGDVIEKHLPEGRYAVALHKGSRETLDKTVYAMYRDWLPQSGEELADLPCIFSYYNFDHEVAETALLTECWLALKD